MPVQVPPVPVESTGDLGPQDRSQAWTWLGVAVLGFLAGEIAAYILGAIGVGIAHTPGGLTALAKSSAPPVWFVAVELVGLWIGFGGAAYAISRHGRHVGFSIRLRDGWYVALGLGLQLVLSAVYAVFHPKNFNQPVQHLLGAGSGWLLVIPGIMVVLVAPVFEELYFRGVVLRAFLALTRTEVPWVGVAIAVVMDGLLFGLAHLGNDGWVQLPGLAFVGMVLALVTVRNGRLGPAIVTHASFNMLTVIAYAVSR